MIAKILQIDNVKKTVVLEIKLDDPDDIDSWWDIGAKTTNKSIHIKDIIINEI